MAVSPLAQGAVANEKQEMRDLIEQVHQSHGPHIIILFIVPRKSRRRIIPDRGKRILESHIQEKTFPQV